MLVSKRVSLSINSHSVAVLPPPAVELLKSFAGATLTVDRVPLSLAALAIRSPCRVKDRRMKRRRSSRATLCPTGIRRLVMIIFSGVSALPLPKITNETWTRALNRSVMIRIPFSFLSSGQFGGADEIHDDENDNETCTSSSLA